MNDDGEILEFYTAQREALKRYAAGLIGDPAKAEDLVQETWLRFHAVAKKRPISEPVSYVYRIVKNLAIDCQRKQSTELRVLAFGEEEASRYAADSGPSPGESAAAKDDLLILEEALQELPDRVRTAIEMRRSGGYKLREIAEHLGISITLAHELIAEGIAHCRQRLKRS
ncbi:MAG: sigma-70 family RNA polymerase sigma factor [Verrucomicrobiota bacterium]